MAGGSITTVDGKHTVTPKIACQKTAKLLEILAQPSATGDIALLRISRDTNLDGTLDQTLNLSLPISGICANGIISCEPGTWKECRYFQWSGDGPSLSGVDEMDQLAGCYCINNSCGANLAWGNLASVLKDLGGGVIGALTTSDPRFGIAEAAIDGPVIRYIGAQTTGCTSDPSLGATAYRASAAAIQGDAFAASRTSKVFQALAASPAASGGGRQRRACSIGREVAVKEVTAEDVIARTAGGYATVTDGTKIDFYLGSPTKHSLNSSRCSVFEYRMTLNVGDPERLRVATLPFLSADDWAQVRIDGTVVAAGPTSWTGSGLPPGNCERDGTSTYSPNVDLRPFLTKGAHEVLLRIAVADRGNGYAQVHTVVDTSCGADERLVDICTGYASDPQCSLTDETVDGVQTVREGVSTGLTPLPQTRLFGSGTCTLQLTRDFFERKRTYLCGVESPGLPSPDLARGAYIIDHSTETMLADRVRTRDGGTATTTRAFSLPQHEAVSACEPVCKTRAPKVNDGAAPDGVVAARQNNPTGWDTFYHACSADNVCPMGPGEQVVSACGCLDDFPEAVVMMQTVRLGGIDLACTATVR